LCDFCIKKIELLQFGIKKVNYSWGKNVSVHINFLKRYNTEKLTAWLSYTLKIVAQTIMKK